MDKNFKDIINVINDLKNPTNDNLREISINFLNIINTILKNNGAIENIDFNSNVITYQKFVQIFSKYISNNPIIPNNILSEHSEYIKTFFNIFEKKYSEYSETLKNNIENTVISNNSKTI